MAMSPDAQAEQVPTPPTPPTPATPPGAPTIPAPSGTPQIIVAGPGGSPIVLTPPRTAREVQALRQRGSELSRQLSSANNRRDQLAAQLEDAQGANKAGIEARITQLDQRIMGIEADIAQNGRLLAAAPASALVGTTEARITGPFGLNPGQITGISIVGTIFIGFPLAIAMARNIWRRGTRTAPAPTPESAERMERLEQALDAIAIEVERVSEGQRFMTRLLTEGSAPALPVGQKAAEAVRLPDREALHASRETA